ncbi:MAG: hypothetical protein GWO11_01860 [Desulfuromonadales bacterium]|nr:hypothetical protein [Desulfuromonadales bacterium]NIR33240.1 hypothetical protein [Desulfuromonadales bacterium]NIS40750.1 hypothetical protein [Desulfuromonadales bacterium]
MNSSEYEKICSAHRSGIQKFVENQQTRQTGLVITCRNDEFVVETEGNRDTWPREKCREQSYHVPSYSR